MFYSNTNCLISISLQLTYRCEGSNKLISMYGRDNTLKDYDHIVIWLDYFNKNLTRRKGRRISSAQAVFDPTVGDLVDAATAAGYKPVSDETADQVRYPRRSFLKSGYIILPKSPEYKKSRILKHVAQKMQQLKTKKKSKEK